MMCGGRGRPPRPARGARSITGARSASASASPGAGAAISRTGAPAPSTTCPGTRRFCRSALARFPPGRFRRHASNGAASRTTSETTASCSATLCAGHHRAAPRVSVTKPACAGAPVRGHARRAPGGGRLPGGRGRVRRDSRWRGPRHLAVRIASSSPRAGWPFRCWAPRRSATRWPSSSASPSWRPQPALVPLALAPDGPWPPSPRSPASASRPKPRCGTARGAPRFVERVLMTHRGLSGPAILQISSYWQFQACAGGPRTPVVLDLLPGRDARGMAHGAPRQPRAAAQPAVRVAPPPPRAGLVRAARLDRPHRTSTPRPARAAMARALNAWTLMPSGTLGYAKAEVTLGGVDTRASPRRRWRPATCRACIFVGEVVDVTGWLGGYNFQWAWSSGWVAGQFA